MRSISTALLILCASCASSEPSAPESEVPAKPFIKIAARGLGLVVYWPPSGPAGFERAGLEMGLVGRLSNAYQQEPVLERREGRYDGTVDPRLFALMVGAGVDDLVIVEVEAQDSASGPAVGAKLKVIALANSHAVLSLEVAPRAGDGKALAETLAEQLTSRWTDPASAPAVDVLKAADRLVEIGACELAIPIYEKELPKRDAVSVHQAHALHGSKENFQACKKKIGDRQRELADRAATFKFEKQFFEVEERFQEAINAAVQESRLSGLLAKYTGKPTTLIVGKGQIILEMRYHPEWYGQKVARRPGLYKGQPVFYADSWEPLMSKLLEMKRRAVRALPAYDRQVLESLSTSIRLSTLGGDYLELEFGIAGGRLLIADTVVVHREGLDHTEVKSSGSARDLRELLFPLGPPRTLEGKLTLYGLVVDFLHPSPAR